MKQEKHSNFSQTLIVSEDTLNKNKTSDFVLGCSLQKRFKRQRIAVQWR